MLGIMPLMTFFLARVVSLYDIWVFFKDVAMGCAQKSFKIVWWVPSQGSLALSQSGLPVYYKGDSEMISGAVGSVHSRKHQESCTEFRL